MDYCYYSKKNKIIRRLTLSLSAIMCAGLTILSLVLMIRYGAREKAIIPCSIILFTVGILAIIEGSFQYRLLNRKYMVNSDGLWVQHTRRRNQFYSWSQISQVCLCEIHKGSTGEFKDLVIWCTVGTIKNGPPDLKRLWNSSHYGVRNFHSVVTIEFSHERLVEFEKYYKGIITDYS